jgi:luciferase-like monooxygenase
MALAKWGVIYNGDTLSLEEILQFASLAESAGADVVWTAEGWRDAFIPLAAIARVAQKLRVGTAIAQMARPPVLTALSALSMVELTKGKFILGVGTAKLAQLECTETGGPDSRVHRMHPFTPSSDAEQSSVIRWNLLQGDRLCPVSAGSGHRIPYLPGGRQPPDDSTGWVSYRWTDTGAAQQRTLSTGHSASEPAKGNLET